MTDFQGWTCDGLHVRRGGRLVVTDITLRIGAHECVSIVGPNGCGKTTLLLALLGVLRRHAGSILVDGRDVRHLPPRTRGRLAAYVPQTVDGTPGLSVRDVVAGGRYAHVSALVTLRPEDRQVVEAAIERCGLGELGERRFDTLSGGERQKTLIAAAIAQDPRTLVLDEPTTALDPAVQLELLRLLRDWRVAGRGLLIVSHDLQLPTVLGGRVIAMRDGRIVADGSVEAVLNPETLAGIYSSRFELVSAPGGFQIVVPDWWGA